MKTTLGHIGINLSSEEKSFPFWKDLLTYLEFQITPDGNHFDASDGNTFLCFSTTKPDRQTSSFHRKQTGLNHIAFTVATRKLVDEFAEQFIKPRSIPMLYNDGAQEYDYSEGYYAVYFEDPDRIKIEIAYEGQPSA